MSFARDERGRLAETARSAGPDAPTLCGEWTVQQLLEHLVVREGSPLGAPGIVVPLLEPLTNAAMERAGKGGFDALVDRFEQPPLWSPARLAAVEKVANTLEFFVHHEDIRRAGPVWEPRSLDDHEQTAIWRSLGTAGKALVRPAGVPVSIRWNIGGAERVQVLKGGTEPVVITGAPGELAMFLFGRRQHQGLTFEGPDDAVAKVRGADLGA